MGNVSIPIYKSSDKKTSNPFTPINLDERKPDVQNEEQEVSKEVNKELGIES